uniref:cell adhesion molecule 4-like n=1 Tax=Myxine glutinosa TaxID=7769 RepID=UPI00358F39CA
MFFLYLFIILTGILLSETQSRDTKFCTIENTMKLCAPLEVKGVQGEDVIIPCRFSQNEGSNIKQLSLVFKKYHSIQYVIFKSSTKYTHWRFEGRIQTVGNPSEGDGSVRIRDLKMEDEGTYGCRFEFIKWYSGWGRWYRVEFEPRSGKRTKVQIDESHIHDTYNCTMEGTKKLCVQREVMGVRGADVILPCRFNHSEGNNIKDLSLVLYKYYNSRYNFIFNSSTNDTDGGFHSRIQTVGILSGGDGSVRIRDLKMEDEGTYRCRFEFYELRSWWSSWHHGALEARERKQTTVRVDVSPKILHVWREFVNSSTSWKLFCEAEAKPRPNITWWNPQGHLVNGSEVMEIQNHQNELQKIVSSYNITGEDLEGNYSCLVKNQHGTADGFVMYGEMEGTSEERGTTGAMIGCSTALILFLLLLIVFGFLIYKKKRNPAEGTDTHSRMNPNREEEEAEITYATRAVLQEHLFPRPEHSPDTSIYAVIKR